MSRYKLLGETWDNIPTKNYKIENNIDLTRVLFYDVASNDKNTKAKIKLSSLLNANNQRRGLILDKIKKYETIYIVIDYTPKINNNIVKNFFDKRLKQINYKLSKSANMNTKIFFVNND